MTPHARICGLVPHVVPVNGIPAVVPAVRPQPSGEQFKERGFTGTVPADQRCYRSGSELAREIIKSCFVSKTHCGLFKVDSHGFH